jgi:hypothetical protein
MSNSETGEIGMKKSTKVNAYKVWNKEEEQRLSYDYLVNKLSLVALSKLYGRPKSGIYQRISLLKRYKRLNAYDNKDTVIESNTEIKELSYKHWGSEQDKNLKHLVNQGFSNNQIAKILKRSEFSIKARVKVLGYRRDLSFRRKVGRPRGDGFKSSFHECQCVNPCIDESKVNVKSDNNLRITFDICDGEVIIKLSNKVWLKVI